jgi:hypothetical protein
MIRPVAALIVVAFATACGGSQHGTATRSPIGLAVRDSVGGWCAEFSNDSQPMPAERDAATLVFAGDTSHISARVRIRARRTADCMTAFPQPRWISYAAYDVDLVDAGSPQDSLPYLALIIGRDTRWTRVARGILRGDIDGDGTVEEVRRCAADEGEHFTVWGLPRNGAPVRRRHEYFDWGAIVDPTCQPGEDGR